MSMRRRIQCDDETAALVARLAEDVAELRDGLEALRATQKRDIDGVKVELLLLAPRVATVEARQDIVPPAPDETEWLSRKEAAYRSGRTESGRPLPGEHGQGPVGQDRDARCGRRREFAAAAKEQVARSFRPAVSLGAWQANPRSMSTPVSRNWKSGAPWRTFTTCGPGATRCWSATVARPCRVRFIPPRNTPPLSPS